MNIFHQVFQCLQWHYLKAGKDSMRKFYESLRENAMEIINFKKKKIRLLKKSSGNDMKMQKYVIFVKKNLKTNM